MGTTTTVLGLNVAALRLYQRGSACRCNGFQRPLPNEIVVMRTASVLRWKRNMQRVELIDTLELRLAGGGVGLEGH